MEFTFTELNDQDNQTQYNQTQENQYNEDINSQPYWKQKDEKPKKKVSFNDILNNMNLVVDKNGVLQYMTSSILKPESQSKYQTNTSKIQNQPLDPNVKHSYIYNKYFKDYKDHNMKEEIRVPKTMEEYKQMLLDDKIQREKQKKIVAELRSTKLFLIDNIKTNNRKLRFMNFR
jgi:hypothetical protein